MGFSDEAWGGGGVARGSTVTLGRYRWKGNPGGEPLSWTALWSDSGETLVVSAVGVAFRPLDDTDRNDLTWENSSLRGWLNTDFYNETFSDAEKLRILEKPLGGTSPVLRDRVFCLSSAMVLMWFGGELDRKCPRASWLSENAENSSCYGTWWLRTPGAFPGSMARVNSLGELDSYGYRAGAAGVLVRPALWLGG
ncbi:DUF6273 domain-containing protein [Succinimonas amylolytica]|uniref:DUF6273 domain-containing protein n=1 Tax=Succinimonas amylolytica TaxID=83769 RepID=UPI0023A8BE38